MIIMPNSRRRKFSVQNEIRGRDSAKSHNGIQTSQHNLDFGKMICTRSSLSLNGSKVKNISHSPLDVVTECDSSMSVQSSKKFTTCDKDTTATTSNINFYNVLTNIEAAAQSEEVIPSNAAYRRRVSRQYEADRRRDKHPHRIKVRSPKRKVSANDRINKRSIGINATDLEENKVTQNIKYDVNIGNAVSEGTDDKLPESSSTEDMCRICHGGESFTAEFGHMISACSCRGTVGRVHVKCLEHWLTESGKSRCELCGTRYSTRRVHKLGVFKALLMWMLSQNAKQLMVDGLGIMLMSPLAVLAAWLSGRTLAGLMTQQDQIAPWPLASTFVLACMTLVCYYCWIVCAATRHALSWWIWYRSHYEVRLQLDENQN